MNGNQLLKNIIYYRKKNQLFLHIYFIYAINSDSFSVIAGFDDKIEYNIDEIKNSTD